MVNDLGDPIKPYLKCFYVGIREYPGFDNTGMDEYQHVDDVDIDKVLARPVDQAPEEEANNAPTLNRFGRMILDNLENDRPEMYADLDRNEKLDSFLSKQQDLMASQFGNLLQKGLGRIRQWKC